VIAGAADVSESKVKVSGSTQTDPEVFEEVVCDYVCTKCCQLENQVLELLDQNSQLENQVLKLKDDNISFAYDLDQVKETNFWLKNNENNFKSVITDYKKQIRELELKVEDDTNHV
jgi:hypothetical protein